MDKNSDNKNFNYVDSVQENIYIAKMLSNISESQKEKVKKLLLKKKKIQLKNSIFAEIRIERINKKINKIRKDKNEEKKIY